MVFYDHKHSAICCSDCELLLQDDVPCCARCKQYRHNVWSLVSRSKRSDRTHPSRHTPFCDLTMPEKAKRYIPSSEVDTET